jgi:hypothetical protein
LHGVRSRGTKLEGKSSSTSFIDACY